MRSHYSSLYTTVRAIALPILTGFECAIALPILTGFECAIALPILTGFEGAIALSMPLN
ncbi:hypothetical protein [Halotia branconii]|uniref:Uncharacterized protein n=1 Tax=Halotia branconii CENA392 TaxID=1539056 RepID=A0AAJ6NRA5_9CYAN|nr:hypothetical protein [Halotia branconii]WGV25279.1 hypothetical protein QI031_26610 [Halotia branconii CENA392]